MDTEALNYDPTATVDNNYCLYIPDCGEDHIITLSSAPSAMDSLTGNIFGASTSGYFTGINGYVNGFVADYEADGSYTSYGCLADGCYNFYVQANTWTIGGAIEVTVDGGDPETFVVGPDEYGAVFPFGLGVAVRSLPPRLHRPGRLQLPPGRDGGRWLLHLPLLLRGRADSAELYVCTFSGGDEVALTITDSQGNVIYDQQGYPDLTIDFIEICPDPEECYTATMSNIAGGDSRNGGYFWIHAATWRVGQRLAHRGDVGRHRIRHGRGLRRHQRSEWGNGNTGGCTDPRPQLQPPRHVRRRLAVSRGHRWRHHEHPGLWRRTNLVAGVYLGGDAFLSEVSLGPDRRGW